MHSSLVRIQNVFGFFTTVAFSVAALVAVSVLVIPQTPSAEVKIGKLQVVKGRPHYYSPKKEEYANIKFDLEADFTSLFTWNTKQLFVYVQATYPSSNPSSPPSQAIIWDTIISSHAQSNPPSLLSLIVRHPFDSPPPAEFKADPKSTKSKKKQATEHAAALALAKAKADALLTAPGLLNLKNVKPKYQITDITGRLAGRENVTLEVGWNIQPWVGALTWTRWVGLGRWEGVKGGRSESFALPLLKAKEGEKIVGKGEVPRAGKAEPVI